MIYLLFIYTAFCFYALYNTFQKFKLGIKTLFSLSGILIQLISFYNIYLCIIYINETGKSGNFLYFILPAIGLIVGFLQNFSIYFLKN
jgi:carbon starvation protein CstA